MPAQLIIHGGLSIISIWVITTTRRTIPVGRRIFRCTWAIVRRIGAIPTTVLISIPTTFRSGIHPDTTIIIVAVTADITLTGVTITASTTTVAVIPAIAAVPMRMTIAMVIPAVTVVVAEVGAQNLAMIVAAQAAMSGIGEMNPGAVIPARPGLICPALRQRRRPIETLKT